MTLWSPFQALFAGVVSGAFLVAVVLLVWWLDRYDREPLGVVVVVFCWGALGASTLAVVFETRLVESALTWLWNGAGTALSATLFGVLVEESLKAVGIVAVAVLSEKIDNPTDGLVYGSASGLGFAATENLLQGTSLAVVGTPGTGLVIVLVRAVSAALLHGLASGAFGALLGLGHLTRSWPRRLGWCLLGLVVACGVHGTWNLTFLGSPAAGLALLIAAAPVLLLVWLGVLQVMLGAERRILRRELADEVRLGVLPAWVAEVLPSYRRRIRSDWWPNRDERTVIARLLTRLAFRKHAVSHLPAKEATLAGLEVLSLRRKARRTLGLENHSPLDGIEP